MAEIMHLGPVADEPMNPLADEALYWLGVARYLKTHQRAPMMAAWIRLHAQGNRMKAGWDNVSPLARDHSASEATWTHSYQANVRHHGRLSHKTDKMRLP